MKKALGLAFVLSTLIYFSSCRKCFTCSNECTQCLRYDSVTVTISDTINNIITTRDSSFMLERNNIHCSDDATNANREDYLNSIAYDTAQHFVCTVYASTYKFDFCTNKSGSETYPSQHDHGGRAPCIEK